MSIKFQFTSNTRELANLIGDIASKGMPSEAAKALNRSITYVKKEVAADVNRLTGISVPLLKRRVKQIKNKRASPKNLKTMGFVGEATIPVSKVSPKPRKAGTGVTYKTVTGQPIDPHAFHATMRSGKKTAWVRKTRARGSLTEKQIKIGPHLRRSTRRIMRGPAQRFFEKTFFQNMEKRITKSIARRGLTRR